METKLARVTLGIVVLALNAPLALASTTEYTDPLSFGAAAGPLNTYNFEGIAPSGFFVQQDVTLGDATIGATFTAGSGSLDYVVDANAGIANYGASFFTGQSTDLSQYASEVVCTLSGAGTTAIGFTYGDFYQTDAGIGITASLSTGDAFLLNAPLNTGVDTGFVGFVSDTPITSVSFVDAGSGFDVINFTSVPEPGTLALMTTGLLGVALLGRRRRVTVR